jgi:hypothetical protein
VRGDSVEVVGQKQQGAALRATAGDEQLQDLCAQRRVDRRGGLVGYQQLRVAPERHRDADALGHPSRELMRVRLEHPRYVSQADFLERVSG